MSDETLTPATAANVTNVAGDLVDMSTDTDTDTSGDTAVPAPQVDAEPSETPADTGAAEQPDTGSKRDAKLADEAAKWRVTARQAETKLLVAEARIADMQRAEINAQLAKKLALPEDFWLATDSTLEDLTTDGKVDLDKVDAAAEAVTANRPHWRATLKPIGAPSSAVTGDGQYNPAPATPTWQQLLKGNTAG